MSLSQWQLSAIVAQIVNHWRLLWSVWTNGPPQQVLMEVWCELDYSEKLRWYSSSVQSWIACSCHRSRIRPSPHPPAPVRAWHWCPRYWHLCYPGQEGNWIAMVVSQCFSSHFQSTVDWKCACFFARAWRGSAMEALTHGWWISWLPAMMWVLARPAPSGLCRGQWPHLPLWRRGPVKSFSDGKGSIYLVSGWGWPNRVYWKSGPVTSTSDTMMSSWSPTAGWPGHGPSSAGMLLEH